MSLNIFLLAVLPFFLYYPFFYYIIFLCFRTGLLVINSSWYELTLSDSLYDKFKKYEILFVGKFDNLKKSYQLPSVHNHDNFNKEALSTLEKPLILISGVSWDLDKFDTQKKLVQNFIDDGLNIRSVTYNPEGALYGFDVFEYPQKIIFPDIVCSINNYLCCVENNKEFDAWIINVGGGMFVNNFNKFSFGKLSEAYFHAADIDVLVLCVPAFIDIEQFDLNVKKASTYGIKNILFVISHNTFESSTLKSFNSIKTYRVSDDKYLDTVKHIREISNEKIFTDKDVENGNLYAEIIKLLG